MKNLKKQLTAKEILLLWYPLVLSGIFNQSYSIINTKIVSEYLNSDAVAVMGALSPYKSLQSFIFAGMTTGIGLVICRNLQSGREVFARICRRALVLVLALDLLALLCIPMIPYLITLLHVPKELVPAGKGYLLFVLLGACAIAGRNIMATILNGMGEMKLISVTAVFGVLSNSLLSYYLIAVRGTQVWGCSFAIFLTELLLFGVYFFYFLYRRYGKKADISSDQSSVGASLPALLAAAMAKPIMMGLVAVGSFYVQAALNQVSKEAISGISYSNTVTNFFMELIIGVASLSAAIYAQSAAAMQTESGKTDLLCNHRKLKRLNYICCLFIILIVLPFADRMILLLGNEGMNPTIVSTGSLYLRVSIVGFPGLALYLTNRSSLHAIGRNKYLPLFGFIEMTASIVAARLFFPIYGIMALAVAVLAKWIIPGVVSECIMRREVYEK